MLRAGHRGGLTAAVRSFGGRDADATDFVRLEREHRKFRGDENVDQLSNEDLEDYVREINAHLFRLEGKGRRGSRADLVHYYDAGNIITFIKSSSSLHRTHSSHFSWALCREW